MKYKCLKAIAYSGRFRAGAIVEMSEEAAAAFGSEYVSPIGESPVEPPAPPEGEEGGNTPKEREQELSLMTVPELKAKADELGLTYKASINKKELVAAIVAKESEPPAPPEGEEGGEETSTGEGEEGTQSGEPSLEQ